MGMNMQVHDSNKHARMLYDKIVNQSKLDKRRKSFMDLMTVLRELYYTSENVEIDTDLEKEILSMMELYIKEMLELIKEE